jgi:hypothetical protein
MTTPIHAAALTAAILLTQLPLSLHAVADPNLYDKEILPALQEYCYDCHGEGSKKGGVILDKYADPRALTADIKTWLSVWRNLDAQLMPPSDKPQPTPEKLQAIKNWIEEAVFKLDPAQPDPGRVTIRRLNRQEYQNTIRDLFGVEFHVYDQFPADDTGYGFDTIGDVLNISPLLLEKYLDAAQDIVASALNPPAGLQGRKILPFGPPAPDPKMREIVARETIRNFATRAFRRPLEEPYLERLLSIYRTTENQPAMGFEKGIGEALKAVLASPRFIFRSEIQTEPDNPGKIQNLDEFALASRLSYFLWSTMPDEELFKLAREEKLRANLRKQVDRMVKDYRFTHFTRNFVGQWLQTRDVEAVPIQGGVILGKDFQTGQRIFSSEIRRSMRTETEMLFQHIARENLPAMEFLTANYTFLNESLAQFYGIPGVTGNKPQKVDLPPESLRGGYLTHGSFLVVTSNPTRTSPVKRGLFVLENLLGAHAPPAPPDVPTLEQAKKGVPGASMRKLMEIHRQNPLCSSCHTLMDPIGLALENFTAVGQYRANDGGKPIDSAGVLATGEKFNNIAELTHVLATKRSHDFYRCLTEKTLTYAIGRGLEYYDTTTVSKIVGSMEKDQGTLKNLLYEIVESAPFQKRRGDGEKVSATASQPVAGK